MSKNTIIDTMNANPIIAAVGRNIARQMFEDSKVDGNELITKKMLEWRTSKVVEGGKEHEILKDAVAFYYAAFVREARLAS